MLSILSSTNTPYDVRQELVKKVGMMDTDRQLFRPHWQELQRYILPDNGVALQGQQNEWEQIYGGKTHEFILDGAATRDIDIFAAGMQSGLTSPSRPWFKLSLNDPDLTAFLPVKRWLESCEERMRTVFDASNCYASLHHLYRELPVFGTAAQIVLENFETVIRCRPFTIGEYWLALNADLAVDVFYRHLWYHAPQMIEKFGRKNCSQAVCNAYDQGNVKAMFQVIQAIEPNTWRTTNGDIKNKKYRSVYFELGGGGVVGSGGYVSNPTGLLRVRGYDEFPVQAPRWNVIGSKVYGRSRGMDALADIKMLQRFTEAQLVNYDKAMEPPVVAPSSMKNSQINTIPSGVSYSDDMGQTNVLRPIYEVPNMIESGEKKIESIKGALREWFFTDLFLMLSNQPTRSNVTATEISERHEEKLLVLGPVLERVHGELLDPLIARTFAIMGRMGVLPPPPRIPQLRGRRIKVEYVSALAVAAKMTTLSAMDQFVGRVGQIAQINPDALDNVDFDEYVRTYADDSAVPSKLLRDPEQIAKIREQRAQQQRAAQMGQSMQIAAKTAKDASAASLDGNSALAALTGRVNPSNVPAAT